MAREYVVHYKRKTTAPDNPTFWQWCTIGPFHSRHIAEQALANVSMHPEFRTGSIGSEDRDKDDLAA